MHNTINWKQFIEGQSILLIGPYQQINRINGCDCIREYWDNDNLIAYMIVHESNTEKNGNDCNRTFYIEEKAFNACSHIYIPTEEDWEEWDNAKSDFDDEAWLKKIREK